MLFLFLLILAIPVGFIALMFYILKRVIQSAVQTAVKEEIKKLNLNNIGEDNQN